MATKEVDLTVCPKCGSEETIYLEEEFSPNEHYIYQHGQCSDCGAKWVDTYKFEDRKLCD